MTSWPSQEGNRPRLLGLAGTKLHCTAALGQEFTKTSRDGISEYASQTTSMFETICHARYLHEYLGIHPLMSSDMNFWWLDSDGKFGLARLGIILYPLFLMLPCIEKG